MRDLLLLLFYAAWLAGIVLAASWWKLIAIFMPLYAIYLVAERLMQAAGIV